MEIKIRQAAVPDAAGITRLSAQLGYAADDALISERLNAILADKRNCVFVAVENDAILGWIHAFYSMRIESGFFVEIGGLVVDENCRRKGVGKHLVNEVLRWAQTVNCNMLRVRCNVKRTESHQFYISAGFVLNKAQKVFDKKL